MKPFIGARAIIPKGRLTPAQIQFAKDKLVFASTDMDVIKRFINFDAADPNVIYDEEAGDDTGEQIVNEFHYHELGRCYSVPREWARQAWPHIRFRDKTSYPRL